MRASKAERQGRAQRAHAAGCRPGARGLAAHPSPSPGLGSGDTLTSLCQRATPPPPAPLVPFPALCFSKVFIVADNSGALFPPGPSWRPRPCPAAGPPAPREWEGPEEGGCGLCSTDAAHGGRRRASRTAGRSDHAPPARRCPRGRSVGSRSEGGRACGAPNPGRSRPAADGPAETSVFARSPLPSLHGL